MDRDMKKLNNKEFCHQAKTLAHTRGFTFLRWTKFYVKYDKYYPCILFARFVLNYHEILYCYKVNGELVWGIS